MLNSIIETLNFSSFDKLLILLSPLCSILGSFAHICIIEIKDPNRMPGEGGSKILTHVDALGRMKWLLMRLFLGGILGLLFAFYFVGTLNESSTTFFKLLAFAILIGYSAPRLWRLQEKMLMQKIEEKIKTEIKSKIEEFK